MDFPYNNEREISSLWHLYDDLTVEDAAALVADEDPGYVAQRVNDTNYEYAFSHVLAAKKAIINAINSGKLKATLRYDIANISTAWEQADVAGMGLDAVYNSVLADDGRHYYIVRTPDWAASTVDLDALRDWLRSRKKVTGFFFENETATPGYLSADDPRYSPKLAAAVNAWLAVTDPGGKSPKQALERWLREHASEFDMVDDEGNPVKQGVEECSAVANWNRKGGAPKTPGA